MLSLPEIKDSLGDEANKHSDEELLQIRDDLYELAEIAIETMLEKQQKEKTAK